jgi:hypothetical protein
MGGVMVVYGPPITHSLPPAVGASRTSQFMISKGPAVAQSEHLTLLSGGGATEPSLRGRAHGLGPERWQRPSKLPREALPVGSGEWGK